MSIKEKIYNASPYISEVRKMRGRDGYYIYANDEQNEDMVCKINNALQQKGFAKCKVDSTTITNRYACSRVKYRVVLFI